MSFDSRLTSNLPLAAACAERAIYLRPSAVSDAGNLARWLNDAAVTTSLTSAQAPTSWAAEEELLAKVIERHGKDAYHFAVCLVEGDVPIGWCALFDINPTDRSAAIMLVIGERRLWGSGLGACALRVLMKFGFANLGLERLWLNVHVNNWRARHLYAKVGFAYECTLRRTVRPSGRRWTLLRLAISKGRWTVSYPDTMPERPVPVSTPAAGLVRT